ncbi:MULTISPECIES: phosphatidylglycerophosphatase A family protein [Calditerrivibrio]|uniref:Phosphatidylglycerophosphatase A n=1 Tax=Calditerrivibrio nitroreducens TaxID=477976 RepID=A0A2J6WRJ9_9BACT|nr:MAG: phosphatidylglycerophosphatase A [Calditerrivibrio nitroreducens]
MDRFYTTVATGFFTGFSSWAPGTVGTLVAIPIYFLVNLFFSNFVVLLVGIGLLVLGYFASEFYLSLSEEKDPKEVVIDEIAAFYLLIYFAPLGTFSMIIKLPILFGLFRLFDIIKLYPANLVERFEGGLGIMLDDLVAAGYALVAYLLILWAL